MIQQKYCVRVILTDESLDTITDILHGEGSSLGPTFDKIQEEAKMIGGSFEEWEPTCCDYCFPTKEAANEFKNKIVEKFKNTIMVEDVLKEPKVKKQVKFKKLPEELSKRIGALTPKKISNIKLQIQLLENDYCLFQFPEKFESMFLYRGSHYNMKCKVTGKIRSKALVLRSLKKNGKYYLPPNAKNHSECVHEIESAKKAGWTDADIAYTALIKGLMTGDIIDSTYLGQSYPEIQFACDSALVVIYDFNGEQFVGWFFYNQNLDELAHFSKFPV